MEFAVFKVRFKICPRGVDLRIRTTFCDFDWWGCGTVESPKTKIFDREYKLPGYLLKSECLMDFLKV